MPTISFSNSLFPTHSSSPNFPKLSTHYPSIFPKSQLYPHPLPRKTLTLTKSSETELSVTDKEWLKKLPDKKKPLYSHSLPGIEAWLKKLGFVQSEEDLAVWCVEKVDWHAQLSLDTTDLYISGYQGRPHCCIQVAVLSEDQHGAYEYQHNKMKSSELQV